jgi:hypothetical protein
MWISLYLGLQCFCCTILRDAIFVEACSASVISTTCILQHAVVCWVTAGSLERRRKTALNRVLGIRSGGAVERAARRRGCRQPGCKPHQDPEDIRPKALIVFLYTRAAYGLLWNDCGDTCVRAIKIPLPSWHLLADPAHAIKVLQGRSPDFRDACDAVFVLLWISILNRNCNSRVLLSSDTIHVLIYKFALFY